MTTDIIQHHEQIDFKTFYETISSGFVGIDYHDFELFMNNQGEKHSFIGTAVGPDRIKDAIINALAADEAIATQASSIMITILRSPKAEHPLNMKELEFINEYVSNLSDVCDVVWGIADDPSLGNAIKVILLMNL